MHGPDLRQGIKDVAPVLLGVAPFGIVAGFASANVGLALGEAVAMSVVVFAGAAQLAALDLLGKDASLVVVLATATVINLRMAMYSASIAPYFRRFSRAWKATLAYLLVDQAYALSVARYRSDESFDRRAYYLGVAATTWLVWQLTTVVGYLLGNDVPPSWGLEFAVPLVFLALLVPAIEDRPSLVAAVVGGVVAVAGTGLPLNLGLMAGAVAGVAAGLVTEPHLGGGRAD